MSASNAIRNNVADKRTKTVTNKSNQNPKQEQPTPSTDSQKPVTNNNSSSGKDTNTPRYTKDPNTPRYTTDNNTPASSDKPHNNESPVENP